MTRTELFERTLFALIATALCIFLAFRPVPEASSANDTVRYIADLHQYCSGRMDHSDLLTKAISYELFYAVTLPACFTGSDSVFLFEVASFLPIGLLLFAKWRSGAIIWAVGLLFSVYALELETNAMRQSLGMVLFFGSLSLSKTHRVTALFLGGLAAAAHPSVLAFIPLLLWMSGEKISKAQLWAWGGLILISASILAVAYWTKVAEFIGGIGVLGETYSIIYANELNLSFILFMVLPLLFVYGVRFFFARENITEDERRGIIYSIVLLSSSYVIFPYITYRFAIFSFVLQIFLVLRSERPGLAAGSYVFIGLLSHLLLMLAISNHFAVLIYG